MIDNSELCNLKVNRSLALKKNSESNEIEFFDGKSKSIEVENIEALWELLQIIDENGTVCDELSTWSEKYSIIGHELECLLTDLVDIRVLIPSVKGKKLYERYDNFFGIYSNGSSVYSCFKDLSVLIIGAGTIGSTLTHTLVKMGVTDFHICDADVVSAHNINSQTVYTMDDIGQYKVEILKNKLSKEECSIKQYKLHVDDDSIGDIERIIIDSEIDVVISCFDESSYDIHNRIYSTTKSSESLYIITGYSNDDTISVAVSSDVIRDMTINSYKDYEKQNVLNNNTGTIIQSYITSLQVIHIILRHLDLFDDKQKCHFLKYDFSSMDSISKDIYFENSYENIKGILKEVLLGINDADTLKHIFDSFKEVDNESIDNRVVSLIRALSILMYFDSDDEIYEIYDYYIDDYLEQRNQLVDEDYSIEYNQLIDNIFENHGNLHLQLATINYIEDDIERKSKQKDIYNIIIKKSAEILDIFIKSKMNINKQVELDFTTINGLSIEEVNLFNNRYNRVHTLFKRNINKLISKTSNGIDYLYLIEEDKRKILNIVESLEIVQKVFSNNKDSLFVTDLDTHFDRVLDKKLIINKAGSGIFTTHYFPELNDSIVVIDHFGTIYSLLLIVHEIGHSFINRLYMSDFYNKSQVVINEALAQLVEIIFVNKALMSDVIDDDLKTIIYHQYISRLNQLLLSAYASNQFESKLIDFVGINGNLSLSDYLRLYEEDEKENSDGEIYENQKYSRLNLLINEQFICDYKHNMLDVISFSYAIHIYENFKDNFDVLSVKLSEYYSYHESGLVAFEKVLFNNDWEENTIDKALKSINDHLYDISERCT